MFKRKKDDQQAKTHGHGLAKKELTDEELGRRIGAVYHETIAELAKLLGSKPDVPLIRQQVLDLRDRVISELVTLGKTREARDEQRRRMIDAYINLTTNNFNKTDYQAYSDAVAYYRPKDKDLGEVLFKFNIITQYASFDLLKKQEPKEAERLGLK
ncbi:MAG: hypothetical protein GYA24_09490 [Candidatus Lokiarchaeota archaeon]|nr:hypothetical protein [Candidatus Lokiarchaeota archaeon]